MSNFDYNRTFVCFLDILGFQKIVANVSHENLIKMFRFSIPVISFKNSNLNNTIKLSDNYYELSPNSEVYSTLISDSLVLWTNNCSASSFLKIINAITSVIWESFSRGFPIRAALTCGSISGRCYNENVTFPQIHLFGKAIVDAYQISENTNWMGCEISKDAIENYYLEHDNDITTGKLFDAKQIVHYLVPHKIGNVETSIALNWMQYHWRLSYQIGTERRSIRYDIRKAFSAHNKSINSWDIECKINNT